MLRLAGSFLALGVLLAGFGAQPALAHNALASSDPATGAILTEAPTVWKLTFTKEVPLSSATAEVVAADGVRTPLAAPTYGVSKTDIQFAFPAGLTGSVTARWRLVGTDGHVVTERISFTVNAAVVPAATTIPSEIIVPGSNTGAPTDTTATPLTDSAITKTVVEEVALTSEPVRYAVRAFAYLGLLLVGGMLFTELFIARGVLDASRAREATIVGAALFALAPLLQTLIFLNDSREFGVIGSLPHIFEAFDTTAGSMLLLRFILGVVLLGGIVRATRTSSSELVALPMLIASGLYLLTLAYTGHSRSMKWPILGVPAAVVHTMSTVVWLGGLIVFVFFVIPSLQPAQSFEAFKRFGKAASYAVTAMVITGVIQTVRLHSDPLTLFTQTHGRWLLLKLVLVASMLKIGDINRRRLLRKLPVDNVDFAGRIALLRRASVTEIANGALVMLATAALVASSFG